MNAQMNADWIDTFFCENLRFFSARSARNRLEERPNDKRKKIKEHTKKDHE
jgi:hypothetical protein